MSGEEGRIDSSWLARLVDFFLTGNPQPLLIAFSILTGVIAIGLTPREEEPPIVVPMADVHVEAPGLTDEEVERHVATRLEKLFSQIDGVEHVYSGFYPGWLDSGWPRISCSQPDSGGLGCPEVVEAHTRDGAIYEGIPGVGSEREDSVIWRSL